MSQFLEKYKTFEETVENILGISVYEYENRDDADSDETDKIRILRQVRNYTEHHRNGEKFVRVDTDAIKFLDSEIAKIKATKQQMKDVAKKVPAITKDTTIRETVVLFQKWNIPFLVVVNDEKEPISSLPLSILLSILTSSKNMDISVLKTASKLNITLPAADLVGWDDPAELNKTVGVRGKGGKYAGMVIKQE